MKLVEFKKGNNDIKEKVIESFKDSPAFIAVSIKDGNYKIYRHGMSAEQIFYACELVKLNYFHDCALDEEQT